LKKSLIETRVCQETVLKWAIEGCLAWQKEGLKIPQMVRDAVTDYHESCDDLGNFLSECYRRASEDSLLLMKEVHDRYVAWCDREGVKALSNRRFRKALGDRGWNSKDVAQGVAVCGIKEAK
jgi:putative DNA primase/helicase